MPPTVKLFVQETEEELKAMSRKEVTLHLNDKQIKYCEYYVKTNNSIIACKKAGYQPSTSHIYGWKLRQNPDVARYIAWLKIRVSDIIQVNMAQVIDQYTRMAFVDIADYIKIKNGRLSVEDLNMIDGTVIQEIRETNQGIAVKFYNKFDALNKLEKFFDIMPKDWKQELEERKVQIAEERLQLEKQKLGLIKNVVEDDGFIKALETTAKILWNNEELIEEETIGDE